MLKKKINVDGIIETKSAGLRQWTRFRLEIEPRTYCMLNNHTTAVLMKYPHDLASTKHFQMGIFKGLTLAHQA